MNNAIYEYNSLRSELEQKISIINNLYTIAITATVTAFGIAVASDNSIIFLLPIVFLIPISLRIDYYTSVVAKISAYIIVFIESENAELKWETRNASLPYFAGNSTPVDWKNMECFILALTSYILFIADDRMLLRINEISIGRLLLYVFTLALLLIELYITHKIRSFNEKQRKWIKRWGRVSKGKNKMLILL